MSYDNNMRGVLFKNSDKKSEKSPDYLGKIEIDNVEYQLSSWINTSKTGVKYMSLTVSPPKDDTARQTNRPAKPAGGGAPFDDAIPFGPEFR
jgi:uncharacterized protein (DUF736 family)